MAARVWQRFWLVSQGFFLAEIAFENSGKCLAKLPWKHIPRLRSSQILVQICSSHDNKSPPLRIIISVFVDIFGDTSVTTRKRSRQMFYIPTDAVTNVCSQEITAGSVNVGGVTGVTGKQAGRDLDWYRHHYPAEPQLSVPHENTQMFTFSRGWRSATPVPCFSPKGIFAAHLSSA